MRYLITGGLALLLACRSSEELTPNGPSGANATSAIASVILSPSSVPLAELQQQRFVPTVRRTDGSLVTSPSLTWSVQAGSTSSTGLYTAGAITVVARASNGVTGKATVWLTTTPPPPATQAGLDVTPATASLPPGGSYTLTATARFSDGTTAPVTATWSATGGTMNGATYLAGLTPGSYAAVGSANGFADTALVTVRDTTTPPPPPPPTGGYTTTFPSNESPLSEGGIWQHLDPLQTVMRSVNGVAFGSQTGSGFYDDASGYVTGYGANYEVAGVVWVSPSIPADGLNRELEILLRWTENNPLRTTPFGDTHVLGYEVNVNHLGAYMSLARFKESSSLIDVVPHDAIGAGIHPRTGDRFRARIEGQRIRVWWNDVLQIDYTDTSAAGLTTGNPGIGAYITNGSPSTNNQQFGWDAITITPLP